MAQEENDEEEATEISLDENKALTFDWAEYLNRRNPSTDYYWRAGILELPMGEQVCGLTKVWRSEPTPLVGSSSVEVIEAMKLPTHKGLIYDRH